MIVVRSVLQAAFGRGGELAAIFAETNPRIMAELGVSRSWRLLTDLTGTFDTVILEVEAESLAEWEQVRGRIFGTQAFQESMGRTQGMVVSGRNEVFTIEARG
jgi:hypothetical protein